MLTHLSGTVGLMIRLLYETGMRIMECVRLRVKDVDFARGEIVVRQGKGARDRMTMLPQNDAFLLRDHLVTVKKLHEVDLEAGYGEVYLPDMLSRKYPGAPRHAALPEASVAAVARARTLRESCTHALPPVQAVPCCGSPDPTSVPKRVAGGV